MRDNGSLENIPADRLQEVAKHLQEDIMLLFSVAKQIVLEAKSADTDQLLVWANMEECRVERLHVMAGAITRLAASLEASKELRRRARNN